MPPADVSELVKIQLQHNKAIVLACIGFDGQSLSRYSHRLGVWVAETTCFMTGALL